MAYSKIILHCLSLLLITQMGLSQNNKKSNDSIQASSRYPIAPVLKGVSANPVVQVRIYVPAATGDTECSGISVTLDQPALKHVDKILTYFNGTEPLFKSEMKPEAITPSSTTLTIPFKHPFRLLFSRQCQSVLLEPDCPNES